MELYDYCVLADSELEDSIKMGAKLGWNGLCVLNAAPADLSTGRHTDLVKGVLIETGKASDVRKEAVKKRQGFEIIVVRGLNEDVNRAAVETPEADILLPNPDTRIDYIQAKLARENDVKIGFDFRTLLHSSGRERSIIFSRLLKNAKLVRKFKAPFVLTSGAMSEWDLRAPSELLAFGRVLGFADTEIRLALSEKMIKENRKRLSAKWIAPGIEVE